MRRSDSSCYCAMLSVGILEKVMEQGDGGAGGRVSSNE
jgi:hypothetical protein